MSAMPSPSKPRLAAGLWLMKCCRGPEGPQHRFCAGRLRLLPLEPVQRLSPAKETRDLSADMEAVVAVFLPI